MKKKIVIALMTMMLVMGITGCSGSDVVNPPENNKPESQSETVKQPENVTANADNTLKAAESTGQELSEDQAREIALNHAGFAEDEVTFIKLNLDLDDGRKVYEVEFYCNGTEYDYDIDAVSGEIVSYDSDAEGNNGSTNGQAQGQDIGEEKAKALALEKVPGAAETDIRMVKDLDDGRTVYEGTIVYDEMKYEFEISAADGTVLEWSSESVYDD